MGHCKCTKAKDNVILDADRWGQSGFRECEHKQGHPSITGKDQTNGMSTSKEWGRVLQCCTLPYPGQGTSETSETWDTSLGGDPRGPPPSETSQWDGAVGCGMEEIREDHCPVPTPHGGVTEH